MSSAAIHWFRTVPCSSPLVLFHGFTGAPRSWDDVVLALPGDENHGTVAALALPGHHPACPVLAGFSANIDAIASILTMAGRPLLGAHVVGYSLGARAALGLAVRHPGLVGRLTLIGCHPGLDEQARRARASEDERWIAMLRTRGIATFVAAWEAHPVFATQERTAEQARERQRAIRLGHDAHALAASLEHMGLGAMPDYRPHLRDLPMPVTLVAGQLDTKFAALARDMAAMVPRARLVEVAGCGHNPVLERPHAVAALLAELALS